MRTRVSPGQTSGRPIMTRPVSSASFRSRGQALVEGPRPQLRLERDHCLDALALGHPVRPASLLASLLFHGGQGIREVMLAMSHDSPTATERHYLHIEEAAWPRSPASRPPVVAAQASVARDDYGTDAGPGRSG
jgi:hypothetical protein